MAIDPTGRAAGRGAYLCRDASCWKAAGRRRAIEHALGTSLPEALAVTLAAGPDAPYELTTPPVDAGSASTPEPDTHEGGARGQE